jgi:putative ABC transport system substrate-binding protein
MMLEIVSASLESWKEIKAFGFHHKIPICGGVLVLGEQGCLLSYSPDPYNMGEEAASLADKILRGVPAGTIPVVSPDSYLHFNYRQAQFYGITVPDGILAQAVEIAR